MDGDGSMAQGEQRRKGNWKTAWRSTPTAGGSGPYFLGKPSGYYTIGGWDPASGGQATAPGHRKSESVLTTDGHGSTRMEMGGTAGSHGDAEARSKAELKMIGPTSSLYNTDPVMGSCQL